MIITASTYCYAAVNITMRCHQTRLKKYELCTDVDRVTAAHTSSSVQGQNEISITVYSFRTCHVRMQATDLLI